MTEDRRGLSVVIVNWNTKQLLLDLLRSLEGLGKFLERPCEILVVDNASADGSLEAAREAFPGHSYLPQERNLGFAGGVNRGFEAATYEWILLLNTDVECQQEAIRALVDHADTEPGVGILGPRVENQDQSFQESYWRFPSLHGLLSQSLFLYKLFPKSQLFNGERYAGRIFDTATRVDAVSGCVFLLRAELLKELGGLDEGYFMYFEETDFCYRALEGGYTVQYAPVASFIHFGGVSARLEGRRNFLEFRRSQLRFFRKHRGMLAALLARVLLLIWLLLRLPIWMLLALQGGRPGRVARERCSLHLSACVDLVRPRGSSRSRSQG